MKKDRAMTTQWTGEHALTDSLLRLVEKIDYSTADEDTAQDMLCSLLQRMHRAKTQADFKMAVHFALKDARRKRAQMNPAGVNWEDLPDDELHGIVADRRKDQRPGAIRPYEGSESPVETIPQEFMRRKVIDAEQTIGQFRFNRACQVSAYCMD